MKATSSELLVRDRVVRLRLHPFANVRRVFVVTCASAFCHYRCNCRLESSSWNTLGPCFNCFQPILFAVETTTRHCHYTLLVESTVLPSRYSASLCKHMLQHFKRQTTMMICHCTPLAKQIPNRWMQFALWRNRTQMQCVLPTMTVHCHCIICCAEQDYQSRWWKYLVQLFERALAMRNENATG